LRRAPQTTLAFAAAALSGETAPVAVRHEEIAHISEHHDDNVLYDAWTAWYTGVQGKVVAAQVLEEVVGQPCVRDACADIFTPSRAGFFAMKAAWHVLAVDDEEQVAEFARKLEATLAGIPEEFHALQRELIALARTPPLLRPWRFWGRPFFARPRLDLARPRRLLKRFHAFRRSLRALIKYRRLHRAKQARYLAGTAKNIRYYAREGY
jgi:hypothetical protein